MENKEIIKALECCGDTEDGCLHCPLLGTSAPDCGMRLCRESLDLINRQQAEIEMLNNNISAKATRNEAIKDFAERLCEVRVSNDPVVIAVKVELKEMVGEDK